MSGVRSGADPRYSCGVRCCMNRRWFIAQRIRLALDETSRLSPIEKLRYLMHRIGSPLQACNVDN